MMNIQSIGEREAYLLGLIWADGHIQEKYRRTILTSTYPDAKDLEKILEDWKKYISKPKKKHWKIIATFQNNNELLFNFLYENDYVAKSHLSADKILTNIPVNFHYLFFRGLSDGDGCFYISKRKQYSYTLASSLEQDWTFFTKVLNQLEVKHKVIIRKGKKKSHSVVRFTSKSDINKFGKFIYQNFENQQLGLKRKYEKWQLVPKSS